VSEVESKLETSIRCAWAAGDYDTAATIAIREYGPEILGVLAARLRNRADASEVFSQFSEDFWKGLPRFKWRCSARVWAYKIARNAAIRYVTSAQRQPGRHIPLSEHPTLERLVEDIRTTTLAHLRTENKSRIRELREQLSGADQEVLILRVDKRMSFRDMAIVLSDPEPPQDEDDLKREAARLRKQFQLAKERLRALAQEQGLI